MAVLGENEDGSPKPLPARAGILTCEGGEWRYRFFEDEDSNVFQINAIRSYEHGLVFPRPLAAPWPRQVDWRAFLKKIPD